MIPNFLFRLNADDLTPMCRVCRVYSDTDHGVFMRLKNLGRPWMFNTDTRVLLRVACSPLQRDRIRQRLDELNVPYQMEVC